MVGLTRVSEGKAKVDISKVSSSTLTAEDFQPLQRTVDQRQQQSLSSGRSRSYWEGVWWRLKRNTQAMISLGIIILLLLFTLLGPLFWSLAPEQQAPGLVSQPASGEREALIVDQASWTLPRVVFMGQSQPHQPVQQLRTLVAHTEWVRLQWQPVSTTARYAIYRHDHQPKNRYDLGLPLAETRLPGVVGFEDRLKLTEKRYYYSVVAIEEGEHASRYTTIAVKPVRAISILDAQLQGLVPVSAADSQWVGKSLVLPAHPLGTDALGRDMLSRLMYGARTSLFIGIFAPVVFIALGGIYGAVAGYMGGNIDNMMMRIADFVIALPFLLFMILLKIAFGIGPGESGIVPMLVAMVLLNWPLSARLVRGQVLQLREEPYIDAARLSGASSLYLIFRHMLPNVLGVLLVSLSFAIPSAIFTEAFLSFIGMGVVPPTPSWGSMSNDGLKTLLSHPHELLIPSFMIGITVLAFNLLGDALRDALDIRLDQP